MFLVLSAVTRMERHAMWIGAACSDLLLRAEKPLLLRNILLSACPR